MLIRPERSGTLGWNAKFGASQLRRTARGSTDGLKHPLSRISASWARLCAITLEVICESLGVFANLTCVTDSDQSVLLKTNIWVEKGRLSRREICNEICVGTNQNKPFYLPRRVRAGDRIAETASRRVDGWCRG